MTGDFRQKWMFKRGYTFLNRAWELQDKDCYNACPLVEAIVARGMDQKRGLSHVFLGHDDIPYGHDDSFQPKNIQDTKHTSHYQEN